MENKTWKFWDDSLGSFEEYENSLPQRLFQEYGELLEKDTENLLSYDIVPTIDQSYTLVTKISFFITVPKSDKRKRKTEYESEFFGYRIPAFEVIYSYEKVYPCKFHSFLTENKYDVTSFEDLREKIKTEIKENKTGQALANLIYHFYDEDTIKKMRENE
jgi:hypothetical protein